MSRPYAQRRTALLLQHLSFLWSRNERQDLKRAETELVRDFLSRMRTEHSTIGEAYSFAERQPPKDCRFDAWGKRWCPETDTFEWERFPNCYMEPESCTTIGSKLVVCGLPDYAKLYKIVWWTTIVVPPVILQDNRLNLD